MSKKKKEDIGMSPDDAFADDDDVEYAQSKPQKIKKKEAKQEKKISEDEPVKIIASKPIEQIKKGDKIKVDSLTLEVDAHIVLIEHSNTTKEMAIECFDKKTDKDYQLRYFSDSIENSIEVYELKEIVYDRIKASVIEW